MEERSRKSKVKKTVQIDPLDITESLGYKTYRKNGRNSWSKEDDEELRSLIDTVFVELGYKNGIQSIASIQESEAACSKISWESISLLFKNSTRKPKDLRKRWTSSLDPNLKKGKWAPEEDVLLMKAYEKHGPHWLSVAEEISGRTEDQCAKRYIEILGPSSEGRLRKWTLEEDLSLVSKVKLYGTRWRRISSELESRPSLTCRNRWRKIITSVVRGRAPPEIVNAVKEKQEADLINDPLNVKTEGTSGAAGSAQDLILVDNGTLSHIEQGKETNHGLRPKLQNALSCVSLSQSEEEEPDYETTTHNSINLEALDSTYRSNGNYQTSLQSSALNKNVLNMESEKYENDVSDKLASKNRITVFERDSSRSTAVRSHMAVKSGDSEGVKAASLGDPSLGDSVDAQSSINNGLVENRPSTQAESQQDPGKLPFLHAGQMEWKFTLKDTQGLSLSSGTIGNSELVKELIDQARKYCLKISIHQHIHNHYGQQADAQTLHSNFQDTLSGFRNHNTVPPSNGGVLSHSNPDFFNSPTEYRTAFGNIDHPADNDFLSQTPNYNVFGLEPSPQPDGSQLPTSANFFQKGHSQPVVAQQSRSSPNFPVRPPTGSSGSHSTPGEETHDIGRHRVSHFNYLPPTVKPQLGSSDSTKATDLSKLLNPSPSSSGTGKRVKRPKKNIQSESNPTSLSCDGSRNTSPIDASTKQWKTCDTPGTASSMNEEEGLDFWESLRSLAGQPSTEEDSTSTNQYEEEDHGLFYGLFNGGVNHSDFNEVKNVKKKNDHGDGGRGAILPFNPS